MPAAATAVTAVRAERQMRETCGGIAYRFRPEIPNTISYILYMYGKGLLLLLFLLESESVYVYIQVCIK